MTRTGFAGLTLLLTAACAMANDWSTKAKEEARALIGKEYISVLPDQRLIPHESSCTSAGGGTLRSGDLSESDLSWGIARCQDRLVLTLKRRVGQIGQLPKWKIIDTLLLPPAVTVTDPSPQRLSLESAWDGICEMSGRPNVPYFATVRFGDRDRIDWRTGVEQAWTFDLQQGRIVPMSPEGIVCERLEP